MPGSFFDTNVLLYLVSSDAAKAATAEDLVRGGGTISVQVLNEVANVGRRKLRMSWSDLELLLEPIRRLVRVVPITVATHENGLALARRYKLSIYDAMIVSAAALAECDTLWSEDMHHGLRVEDGLRIANPFDHHNPS